MKEIKKDIFELAMEPETDSICITTNGIVSSSGLAIMGAGSAGAAATKYPNIRANLGAALNKFGNLPFVIGYLDSNGIFNNPNSKVIKNKEYKCLIWSFPTKEHFKDPAKIDLIIKSSKIMAQHVDSMDLKNIYIPCPGCGPTTGKLSWERDVKPEIENILDDRFTITFL